MYIETIMLEIRKPSVNPISLSLSCMRVQLEVKQVVVVVKVLCAWMEVLHHVHILVNTSAHACIPPPWYIVGPGIKVFVKTTLVL